jgi:DNA-binding transcriptional regulator YiaG/predicted nucleic acid-binding Zn ribbon protein
VTPRGTQRISEPFEMEGELVVRVQLTRGLSALINAEDAPLLEGRSFQANERGYARTIVAGKVVWMHHLVLPKAPPPFVNDHINRCPWDNRRKNLRHVTPSENIRNSARADTAIEKRRLAALARELARPTITGAELREKRLAVSVTLPELAHLLGVSHVLISYWELGKRRFSRQQQERYLGALTIAKPGSPAGGGHLHRCQNCGERAIAKGLCARCYGRRRWKTKSPVRVCRVCSGPLPYYKQLCSDACREISAVIHANARAQAREIRKQVAQQREWVVP